MLRSVILCVGVLIPALAALTCGPTPRSQTPRRPADHARDDPRPADPRPPRRARRQAPPRRTTLPIIHANGVGVLRLGRPIPAPLLRPAAHPELHYTVGFHADAQTYEGFRFPKTPVLALFTKGPFYHWFEYPKRQATGKPDPATQAKLAQQAVKHARAGTPIGWIVVDRKGPRTLKGIGIGSTLAELTRAYGALTLLTTPPDFGRDECSVLIKPLKHVSAFFKTCRDARAGGRITRLSLWLRTP
jgi:hypothetical protein